MERCLCFQTNILQAEMERTRSDSVARTSSLSNEVGLKDSALHDTTAINFVPEFLKMLR